MDDRIAEAKKLYGRSGYSKDKPLKITLIYKTSPDEKKVAVALASMWEKAFKDQGLKISIENQEWKVLLANRVQKNYELSLGGWTADYNDATTFLNNYTKTSSLNEIGYNNPEYDKLLVQSAQETGTKREATLEKAAKVFQNDYAVLPLYYDVSAHLVKTTVGGYKAVNALDHVYSRDLYITDNVTSVAEKK